MIFILLLCIAFIICIVMCRQTKFARIILLYYFGCLVLVAADILYVVQFSNYIYLSDWEYKCVALISRLKTDVYVASVVHNLGICILMIAADECINLVSPMTTKVRIAVLLPVIYVFIVNLPEVRWNMHIMLNTADNTESIQNVISVIYKTSIVIAQLYYLLPIVFYIRYIFKTKIFVKKRYGITGVISLMLANLIIFILFIAGPFSPTMFYKMDLMSFPTENINVYSENTVSIILGMCIMIFNTLFIIYYKPFVKSGINSFSFKRYRRKNDDLSENVYMMLHTYKNRFVGIEKLAKMAAIVERENETEKLKKFLNMIQTESEKAVLEISRILRITHPANMEYRIFSIKECINEALNQFPIHGVEVIKEYHCQYDIVLGNKENIVECFVNLFCNAFEAIEQKGIADGMIKIRLIDEIDMLCVSIIDNGCGISTNNIKKVSRPFFTTKQQKVGNGLGLNFVKIVAKAHGGGLLIKSKKDISTSVSLALPCADINSRTIMERVKLNEISNL